MSTPRILLIEDDARIAALVTGALGSHAMHVVHTDTAAAGFARATQADAPVDAIVLDLGLPDEDGVSLLRRLRPVFTGPILALTARDTELDEVLCLEIGADDFLVKPVRTRALLARLRRVLERPRSAHNRGVQLDHPSRTVRVDGAAVELTSAEWDVLAVLDAHRGTVVSRDALSLAVRGIAYDGLDRALDVRVSQVRRKLGDDARHPRWIKSIRGEGYMLAEPG